MKEIYFAAQSLSGEAQAQYLKDHCPDEGLRAEVERLLGDSTESITHVTLDSLVPPQSVTETVNALGPGSMLGHYRIKRKLGAGGMGWVFEADDEKLLRVVAIKVLPPGQDDEPMRRRLMREAQSASALNHPNIVTVYEVGRHGDTDFIAMERVHGKTLRELAGPAGLGIKTALRIAAQIADALAAAHDANIVHRDLKPSNIMVTERGLVKVLDFGIAKQVGKMTAMASGGDFSITRSGEVIGTLSYMSPEQAQGHAVDPRSDIFSFGSVLYEMLSGRRAFMAETGLETIAAIFSKDPAPLRELVPGLPRGVERVIAKCLQKKSVERWQHMSDVKLILQDLEKDFELPAEVETVAPVSLRGWRGLAIGAGVLAAASLAYVSVSYFNRTGPEPKSLLRRVTADAGLSTSPALSRDGKLIAFASDRATLGNLDIWVQQVGGGEPIRLTTSSADETDPAFSPDGTRVAYRSEADGGTISAISTLGGDPVVLAREGRGPRFSPDGRSIAYWTGDRNSFVQGASRIFIADANGGTPRPIHPGMSWAHSPIWSPRGEALLVYGMKDPVASSLDWWVLPLDGKAPVKTGAMTVTAPIPAGNLAPALDWIDDGLSRVLYPSISGDATNLWEVFLSTAYQAQSPARRVTHGPGSHLRGAVAGGATAFSDETENANIWEIPIDPKQGMPAGEPRRVTGRQAPELAPSLSGDGRQMVFIRRTFGSYSVLAMDRDGVKERVLTTSPRLLPSAHVTSDFGKLLFTNGRYDLSAIPMVGGAPEVLCAACGIITGVSSDGGLILYEPKRDEDLLLFDVAARKTIRLAERPNKQSAITGARFSPDGKWIAFILGESAARRSRIFLVPLSPNRAAPFGEWIPVSEEPHAAMDPAWSPQGDRIYFTSERDGFRCIWARRLDPVTKKPVGESFPVSHFHSARQSLRSVGWQGRFLGLNVGPDRLVFAVAELTGNIWLEEKSFAKE